MAKNCRPGVAGLGATWRQRRSLVYGGDWAVLVRDNAIREVWLARLPAGVEGLQ